MKVLVRSLPTVALLVAILGTGSPASAQIRPTEHCVVQILGELKSGEYILSDAACFNEFGAAMSEIGFASTVDTAPEAAAAVAVATATIGIHYDGANFTGSSLTIVGSDCLGGYANMSASWDNRISSTISNFCGRIRHWTGANKTGSSQDTVPSGNLSSPVNNAVSSIQYLN